VSSRVAPQDLIFNSCPSKTVGTGVFLFLPTKISILYFSEKEKKQ
jgi:hypothetical protein